MRESLRFADSSCIGCHGRIWMVAARRAVVRSFAGYSGGSGRGGDRAVADDRLAVHQHRGLARGGGVEGLGELQLERLVATQRAAGSIDHLALAVDQVAVAPEEAALALAGEETEVLRLGLLRHREAMAGGDGAHFLLGHLGEREAEPAA